MFKIDWKAAFREILFIFIGISLAIGFNNWNESRKLNQLEVKMLQEIKNGIEKDRDDIQNNIIGYEGRIYAFKALLTAIDRQEPPADTLIPKIAYLRGTTSFVINSAPYETLKSRGFDLIKNDSLRLKISKYYDIQQEWVLINEKDYLNHYEVFVKPFMIRYFILYDDFRIIDFENLYEQHDVINNLFLGQQYNQFVLELYQEMDEEAQSIIAQIDTEIKK